MEDVSFIGYKDFYRKRKKIRKYFRSLTLRNKWRYKKYVYSNCLIKDFYKDVIWEYLIEEKNSPFRRSDNEMKNIERGAKL